MTVYILTQGVKVQGIYTSRDLAEAAMKAFQADDVKLGFASGTFVYQIEPYGVNPPPPV